MFRKQKVYQLDVNTADATLQNIFNKCHRTTSHIPLNRILLKQKMRTKEFDILLTIILCMLSITILLPIPFLFL